MSNNHDEARRKLDRLTDALARDVDQLTDEEVFQEVTEVYGDPEKVVEDVEALIEGAIAEHGKRRLTAARRGFETQTARNKSNVISFPLDKKRALLDLFARNDPQLREKLTMAARNEEDSEADIDSFLEDLIELGAIDDEGNIL